MVGGPARGHGGCARSRLDAHLFAHAVHQVRACDTLWKAREVLNLVGCHELSSANSTCCHPFKYYGLQIGSCSIDGCSVASRPRANHDHILNFCKPELLELLPRQACAPAPYFGTQWTIAHDKEEVELRHRQYITDQKCHGEVSEASASSCGMISIHAGIERLQYQAVGWARH